nr:MAG TPA: hypothetical protein [Caudoviricetes sp.]
MQVAWCVPAGIGLNSVSLFADRVNAISVSLKGWSVSVSQLPAACGRQLIAVLKRRMFFRLRGQHGGAVGFGGLRIFAFGFCVQPFGVFKPCFRACQPFFRGGDNVCCFVIHAFSPCLPYPYAAALLFYGCYRQTISLLIGFRCGGICASASRWRSASAAFSLYFRFDAAVIILFAQRRHLLRTIQQPSLVGLVIVPQYRGRLALLMHHPRRRVGFPRLHQQGGLAF